jgi:DNA replication protein
LSASGDSRGEPARFSGFPAGSVVATPIANVFFTEVLPAIESLEELRVTLQALRLLATRRGHPRYLTTADFLGDASVAAGLPRGEEASALADALDRAVDRGTLLRLTVERDGKAEQLYVGNGPEGRRALESLRSGEISVWQSIVPPESPRERGERSSIYTLYEQNIGLLTPLIAEELADAERLYPADWLEAAVREAVRYNRRNWKYVQRILENWAVEGKRDEKGGRSAGRAGEATGDQRGRSGWGAR